MSFSIKHAVRDGALRLAVVADNARLEARLLLAHSLGLTMNDLIREPDRLVDTARFDGLIERRLAREPVALIIGHREFWSMDFRVSGATLVPRADSETVIEAALAVFKHRAPQRILDLGTGTGCLLLALLKEFPLAFGIGTDIAPAAAELAKSNAVALGFSDRSSFMVGRWSQALAGRFDLIVSNPPYIPSGDIAGLMAEVAMHEPRRALDGGADGYDAYRVIFPALRDHLSPDGVAIVEIGQGQADIIANLAAENGFGVSLRVDLAEIPRAAVLSWQDR